MTIDADLVTRKLLLISSDLDPLGDIHARGEASYDIDHRLVFDALGNALRDVPRYVAAVNGHLRRL